MVFLLHTEKENLERIDGTGFDIHNFEKIVTRIWNTSPLLSAKFEHFVDTPDLFKISN